jgi:hypothetical protein
MSADFVEARNVCPQSWDNRMFPSEAGASLQTLFLLSGNKCLKESMCAELRLDGTAHLDWRSRVRPRDLQTKEPNEMARFCEERRLVVARSPVVDVVFKTWYGPTGNETFGTLPKQRGCSDVPAGFHNLLICWRVDLADH